MRSAAVVLTLALVTGAPGCGLLAARQTLRHLDDGRTVVAEGRRDVCLRIEDPAGEVVAEDCDLDENPLGMGEYALFDGPDGWLLVGVAPVDVAAVEVSADGRTLDVEVVPSDLTTGFYLAELPADAEEVRVVGRTAAGDPVGDPVRVALPGGPSG